jgi:uncharacterized protein (TIGR02246 family)
LNNEHEIQSLYQQLLAGWNQRNAAAMAEPFSEDGEMIGFDGSHIKGKSEIIAHLQPIFTDHVTPIFCGKVKEVRFIGDEAAVLRAIAGMIPPNKSDIKPELNAHQTLIAANKEGKWRVILFQNTPAQFHGRPDLVDKMTEELRALIY